MGLLVSLAASSARAQAPPIGRPVSQMGYAEADGNSSGTFQPFNPFVPDDSPAVGKKGAEAARKPAGVLGNGVSVLPPPPSGNRPNGAPAGNGQKAAAGEEKKSEPSACDCPGQSPCCDGKCDSCCCGCRSGCDNCPCVGMMLFAGLESFHGIADGPLKNNDGFVLGGNFGVPIPGLRDYGFGVQFGASFGAYDLDGRTFPNGVALGDPLSATNDVQQQCFMTVGIFERATENIPLNWGLGYDWMVNDAYGLFATSPRLTQFRGQIGYVVNDCNEFGFWGAIHDRGDGKVVTLLGVPTTVAYRPCNQYNLFWHHNYESGADSWLWMGVLDKDRLNGQGSLGSFTIGAKVEVPLSERVALYGEAQYMRPSSEAGPGASVQDAFSVGFGLEFFPNGSAKNPTAAGRCSMPVLPLANNGTFLVDSAIR
jgi:hypothetical protein